MKLPVIDSPTYTMKLLSNGETVQYKPYTVKAEKTLLVALESQDFNQVINAVYSLIDDCVVSDIKVRELPNFDLEQLFVNIRSKSVGESVDLNMKCESCGESNEGSYDLTDFTLTGEISDNNKIEITPTVGVVLKYPALYQVKEYLETDVPAAEQVFGVAMACVDYIYDDAQIYKASDVSKDDLQSFLESLTTDQFDKIKQFMETTPKLQKTIQFKCKKCGTDNTINVEGLQSFFT